MENERNKKKGERIAKLRRWRHGAVSSSLYTAGENLALQFGGEIH